MPQFLRTIADRIEANRKGTITPNRFVGTTTQGAVVLEDRRGTRKAEIPNVDTKSSVLGNDPLAIYKPDGAKPIDAGRAMANFNGWTYAAVNAIAMEAVGIQLRLYQVKGKDHKELDDHPLLDILDFPNPNMIGLELKYTLMAHLELTGNFFGLLDGVRDENTPPRAIYPLNPGSVGVRLNKDSFPYKIDHYEYTFDGKKYTFKPHQILHIRYPDPQDPFVGIGFPQTIPTWIDSDNYAMEYNRKYFINGAQVGLYIQTETNVEGNIDRIRKSWKNRQAGVENAHETPVLPKGVELKHTGVTHKDMDFGNLADSTRDRILAGARVSKTILGTAESDTNRATAETADYVFSKRTMKPKMQLVVAYLNALLAPRYGDDLYLTFIDPTPEDKEFRTKEMQASVGNAPIMTQNEARRTYLGLGPVEGGDQLLVPNTMTPAGTTDKPEGEDVAPNLAKTAEGWNAKAIRVRTGGKAAHSTAAQMRKALTEKFAEKLDAATAYQFKSITELTHSEYMEHWKRFDARSQQAEGELRRIFHGINAKQKAEVLERLPKLTGVKKTAAKKALADLFDAKEWIGITIDLVSPILIQLSKDEAAAAFAMVGARQQDILADEAMRDALDRGISKMAHSYNETTLAQLKDKLTEKLTQPEGTNLQELTETVDGVYSFADERRAGMIAQTETYRAANFANKEAWRQSGVVKTVQWYTAEDEKVCAFCAGMEEKGAQPIDSNFLDLGESFEAGGKIFTADYDDVAAPPLHPLCRCYVRPSETSLDE
jgi:HK97 family phage portal protein